jgi:hypothetical protein
MYKMTLRYALMALAVACGSAQAADLQSRPVYRDSAAIRFCPAGQQSAIATLATLEAMQAQTRELYETSAEVYEQNSTHNSRAMRIKWADLARVTCGIAAGYLASGEVNIDRLSQCECNFVRMSQF